MSHDTLVHQIVRPVVRVVAVRTRVTPDHLTVLRLATGVGAAASFACGGAGWILLGTCLFLASALLDRADGELARQTRRFSRHGHRWDLVADCVCTAATFLGLGFGAADGVLGQGSVALGVLAGAGVVCVFWQVNVAGTGALPGYAGKGGRVLADPDDAMFAVPLLLWLAGAETVLALAGVLAPAAALWAGVPGVAGRHHRRDTWPRPCRRPRRCNTVRSGLVGPKLGEAPAMNACRRGILRLRQRPLIRAAALAALVLSEATLAGCAPTPPPEAPQLAAKCEQVPEGRSVEVGGVRLRYVERGEGEPPVVLLHGNGAMAEDFAISGVLAASALRHHRTVAFDRPGYGASERPRDRDWTPQAQAALLAEAFARLGIERPVVVGHSWGTLVALALALDHPEVVSGLVLVSGYYFPTGRADLALSTPFAAPVLGDVLRYTVLPVAGPLAAPGLVRQMFAPVPVPACFTAKFPLPQTLRPLPERASAEETATMEPAAAALAPRYRELRVPVAIVAGDGDRLVDPTRHSVRLHRELPGSLLAVVPAQGHMVHYGAPDLIAGAVDAVAARRRR